jgi:hypothetical protein
MLEEQKKARGLDSVARANKQGKGKAKAIELLPKRGELRLRLGMEGRKKEEEGEVKRENT